jgi:hypothetical protein
MSLCPAYKKTSRMLLNAASVIGQTDRHVKKAIAATVLATSDGANATAAGQMRAATGRSAQTVVQTRSAAKGIGQTVDVPTVIDPMPAGQTATAPMPGAGKETDLTPVAPMANVAAELKAGQEAPKGCAAR